MLICIFHIDSFLLLSPLCMWNSILSHVLFQLPKKSLLVRTKYVFLRESVKLGLHTPSIIKTVTVLKKNNRLAHSVYVRSSFSYKGVFNQQFSPIVSTSWPFLSGYRSSYSPNILPIASGRSGIIIQNNKQGMKHVCTSQSTHFPQCIMSLQSLMAKRIFSPLLSYKNSFLRNLSRPT